MELEEEYVDKEVSPKKKRGNHLIGGNGRKKGSSLKNTIKDPLLEPYYIKIDGNKSYTIMKEGSAQIIGYYTTIINALKRIALEKVDNVEEDTERTLKQYLTEYFTKLENFSQAITI
jgi:hypothetical protein